MQQSLVQASILQLEQRNTEANAVQTGHESANKHSDRSDTVVLLELVQHFGSDAAHLKYADTTEIVDQDHCLVFAGDLEETTFLIFLVQHVC